MKLSGTYLFCASPARVHAALTDPAVLQGAIDDCEAMVPAGENRYDAHLRIRFAGMKVRCAVKLRFEDCRPPASFTLSLEGRGAPGSVQGKAQLQFTGTGRKTEVWCEVDVQVEGLIAAVGPRLMQSAAQRMMDEFFRKVGEQVSSAA